MVQIEGYSFASCNIEGDRHISRVRDYLASLKPDIACLQEAPEKQTLDLANELGYRISFRGASTISRKSYPTLTRGLVIGLAILTRNAPESSAVLTYRGSAEELPLYIPKSPNSSRKEILTVGVSNQIKIGTTHFTWSPDGLASDEQDQDVETLLARTAPIDDLLLAGDFNSLRGNRIYLRMLSQFQDNVPLSVTSTLDPTLHRTHRELVVDYIFTKGKIEVGDVKLIEGISDHKLIQAEIKTKNFNFAG